MTTRSSPFRPALLLAAALLLSACACSAQADEMPAADPEAGASRLVEEVLRKTGGEGGDSLGAWTRSILDRALERAGETARRTVPGQTGSLPAERHAEAFAGPRPASAEVLIFTSLSVPAASWRQWAQDAARLGAAEHAGPSLVLRGVADVGLAETARQVGARLGSHAAGVAIDPRLFRLFGIERVPAVVVVPGGVPACESRGCGSDPAPPHDLVAGNIGLVAALEAVAAEGEAGRAVATAYLERMREESRP